MKPAPGLGALSARHRAAVLLLWLAALALGAWQITRTPFTADLSAFLPATANAQQQVLIDQIKGEKTIHYVKRRRKHSSQRTKGHRQHWTLVRVTGVIDQGADTSGVKSAVGTAAARVVAHDAPGTVKAAAPAEKPAKAAKAAKAAPKADVAEKPKRAAKAAAAKE